jgi:DNA helicase-2/ATP-dependent DNA helicase PcrA
MTGAADPRALAKVGWQVHTLGSIREQYILPAEAQSAARTSIVNPAQPWLDVISAGHPLAVLDVVTASTADLRDIYGYLVEPAYRAGATLLLVADRHLDDIDKRSHKEPIGYPWTLERLRHVARLWSVNHRSGGVPMTPIEELLYDRLRDRGLAPIPQYGIDRFRIDLALEDVLVAIECDGRLYHDPAYDAWRDAQLRRRSWAPIHFSGSEITADPARCAERVAALAALRRTTRPPDVRSATPTSSSRSYSLLERLVNWLKSLFLNRTTTVGSGADLAETPTPAQSQAHPFLDVDQAAAVRASDGVTQVLAPAGSGKTTVLVERVKELRSRGVAPNRILCCTFNRAARDELRERLEREGNEHVEIETFHSLGRGILEDAGDSRTRIGATSHGQWRRLAKAAMDAVPFGPWFDPADAEAIVSDFKLDAMVTPEELRLRVLAKHGPPPERDLSDRRASPTARDREAAEAWTKLRLYELHEDQLAQDDRYDFDDLVFRSVRRLGDDDELRRRWQLRFDAVLVDEYQDIEPAQEYLIRTLAAPDDLLFVVGDEDQCIYSWRRATVQRSIELDRDYPGLRRYALTKNFRCPATVVEASRNLIEHNRLRFPKVIAAGRTDAGEITVIAADDDRSAAAEAARRLDGAASGDVVVLARTARALSVVALGLAEAGRTFWVTDGLRGRLLSQVGEPRVLLAYLRLFGAPRRARPEDVDVVFRTPNRYLPGGAEGHVAQALRTGLSFSAAIARLPVREEWRRRGLQLGAKFFDELVSTRDAATFVARIRGEGGLDRHFGEVDQLNPSQPTGLQALQDAERDAKGLTIEEYAEVLDYRAHIIEKHLDDGGVELATIHGAKGRQWPTVIVAGVDEGELPHGRSLEIAEDDADALEAERRLAYVAFTRAQEHLVLMHSKRNPSRFLAEAFGQSARSGPSPDTSRWSASR